MTQTSRRIAETFSALKEQKRTALIPYITAGDPHPDMTVPLMHSLVDAGADMLELGVPFSDPMADGPVIQKAVERALSHQVSLRQVLEMVVQFRQKDAHTPVILMGYLNPIEAMGVETFAHQAQQSGVDAVLTVDMPPEETEFYLPALKQASTDLIFLVSPTTPESRLTAVNEQGSGFVYYVSLKGVTGSGRLDVDDVATHVASLRQRTAMPVAIGFGIRDAQAAHAMAQLGDAVIIGSALVREIETLVEQNQVNFETVQARVTSQLRCFRDAIDLADAGKELE
ncbi:tryptophan synthase subunit alpha [Thiomicrospira sp. WB1]|uniref:tryptophan synthase subunit alpha n=1 Tax=Thiomicrospira sp. WB1 TaxID=1685380 RepID=UPI0007460413|nr:tryptophan synthase subunit alpha [Thiomicrospira sp. WB1]KUJ71822.1 tryptophan synthase subunit alpha [Thiomicrospira sp. WB1]